ncbi:DUF4158 domain-containing protein [Kitasatospora sp. NPDC001603]|uniref:DUF4158 domain-containing protein n=1 Tax=Kitasatospora sp. NPDC001603 TaxID=3154388 RepID=UPI0033178AB8
MRVPRQLRFEVAHWAVQWGCVRMLGVFPTEDSSVVPEAVVRFAAEQLDVEPGGFAVPASPRSWPRSTSWAWRTTRPPA